MANEAEKKPTQTELLKAIADVLDEALTEYETLTKGEGIDAAQTVADPSKSGAHGVVGDGGGDKGKMVKEEKPEDMEDEEDDEDKDDDKLMRTYKSLVAKMEKRGLMHKMAKSEKVEAPVAPAQTEAPVQKSVDDRFEALAKAVKEVSDTVKKIASAPAPRKGVAGYRPIEKSEEGGEAPKPLRKSEVVGKLLELRKSDRSIDSTFLNRVETGRLQPADMQRLKSLGVIGE